MVLEQKLRRGERSGHVRVKNEKTWSLACKFFVVSSSMSYLYTDLLPLPIRHLVTEMLYARTIYEHKFTYSMDRGWVAHCTGAYTVRRYGPRSDVEVEIVRRILRNKPRKKAGKMKSV